MARPEVAEDGIGELAVHDDVLLAAERVAALVFDGRDVAEQPAEDVGKELGEQFGFLELVGSAGGQHLGPLAQLVPRGHRVFVQSEGCQAGTEHFGAEEGLDFYGHDLDPRRLPSGIGKA